jgi:hypothetical protein
MGVKAEISHTNGSNAKFVRAFTFPFLIDVGVARRFVGSSAELRFKKMQVISMFRRFLSNTHHSVSRRIADM